MEEEYRLTRHERNLLNNLNLIHSVIFSIFLHVLPSATVVFHESDCIHWTLF